MDTTKAVDLAIGLMEQHKLFAHGWRFDWDKRTTRAGACDYVKRIIYLSRPITALNDEDHVRDTVLHEIAHALAPRDAGHGIVWKLMARSIGCSATTCAPRDTVLPEKRWRGTCPAGHVRTRARKPKRQMSCALCSPRFDVANLIVWEDTKQ